MSVGGNLRGFGKPWSEVYPVLYRMLERRYVDNFFDTGELRLSSFSQFHQHTDEQRHDRNEGNFTITALGERTTAFVRIQSAGKDAYVLCASAREPSAELLRSFGCDAAIRIFDALAFARNIARSVPSFMGGHQGYCIYANAIRIKVADSKVESFLASQKAPTDVSRLGNEFLSQAEGSIYCLKRPDPRFIEQVEYRWIFRTAGSADRHLTISVPEARQFCLPYYPAA